MKTTVVHNYMQLSLICSPSWKVQAMHVQLPERPLV